MNFKMSSAIWRPFHMGLRVFMDCIQFLLVCEDAWIREALTPCYAVGLAIGSLIGGTISDRWVEADTK